MLNVDGVSPVSHRESCHHLSFFEATSRPFAKFELPNWEVKNMPEHANHFCIIKADFHGWGRCLNSQLEDLLSASWRELRSLKFTNLSSRICLCYFLIRWLVSLFLISIASLIDFSSPILPYTVKLQYPRSTGWVSSRNLTKKHTQHSTVV